MTTTTVLVISAVAVVIAYALWVGVPLWMIRKHPDTPPKHELPEYLKAQEREMHEEVSRELLPSRFR